jgi:hypothetical protein
MTQIIIIILSFKSTIWFLFGSYYYYYYYYYYYHVGKVLFIKTHCTVNCTFGRGGMACCSPRHKHLTQGQSCSAT